MGKPLDGVRVLDFSMFVSGPYCGRMLAELGAEVLKIEPPPGDPLRAIAPFHGAESAYYGHLNAGKRSVVLDLKRPEDVAAAMGLIRNADVLIHNFRPGVMDRLGLGYEICASSNPGLVYCAISGYGQEGDRAGDPAFAQVIHAASGYDAVHQSYQSGQTTPPVTGVYVADVLGGAIAFGAVQTALYTRTAAGRGSFVDVSLMDAMVSAMAFEVQAVQHGDAIGTAPHRPIATSDGHVLAIPMTDGNFRDAIRVIERPDLLDDQRFASQAQRNKNWDALYEQIEAWAKQRTSADAEAQMRRGGVPTARYRTIDEVVSNPDEAGLRNLRTVEDSTGTYLATGLPFQIHGFAPAATLAVEALGASTHHFVTDAT